MSCSTDGSMVWGSCRRDRQGDGGGSMVSTFGARSFWPLVTPLSDEPDAGAMSPTSSRRHIGQGVVVFAVGLFGNWIAAEIKIRVPRIATWPAAGLWGERVDFFGGGRAWIGGGAGRTPPVSRGSGRCRRCP